MWNEKIEKERKKNKKSANYIEIDVQKLKELYEGGKTKKYISEELGIGYNTVQNKLEEHNLVIEGLANKNKYVEQSKKQKKPINQKTISGEIMDEFDCIGTASKETGIKKSSIRYCLKNGPSTVRYGCKWEYSDPSIKCGR